MSSDDQQAPESSPSINDLAKVILPDDPTHFDEYRAMEALAAIEAMGDDEAVDFLASKVLGNHPDQYIRSTAAQALGRLGNPRAASALQKALNDPSTSNVLPAVRLALGKLGVAEAAAPAPAPARGGFFSRLFGGSKGGAEKSEKKAAQIEEMLRKGGPTTLSGCKEILSITILHEKPILPQYSAEKIAGLCVDQYKKPGWIPGNLSLDNRTPVETIHSEDAARLSVSESNAILAERMAKSTRKKNVDGCSAITFSGDSPALGHTFFSILAR